MVPFFLETYTYMVPLDWASLYSVARFFSKILYFLNFFQGPVRISTDFFPTFDIRPLFSMLLLL